MGQLVIGRTDIFSFIYNQNYKKKQIYLPMEPALCSLQKSIKSFMLFTTSAIWTSHVKESSTRTLESQIDEDLHTFIHGLRKIIVLMFSSPKVFYLPIPDSSKHTCKHLTYLLENPKSFSDCNSKLFASWRPLVTTLTHNIKNVTWDHSSDQLSDIRDNTSPEINKKFILYG